MSKRIPKWLINVMSREVPGSQHNRDSVSSNTRHIMECKYEFDPKVSFKPQSCTDSKKHVAFSETLYYTLSSTALHSTYIKAMNSNTKALTSLARLEISELSLRKTAVH